MSFQGFIVLFGVGSLSKVNVNSWYKDSDGKYLYKKSDSEVYFDLDYNEDFANDEVLEINGAKYLFDSSSHLVTNDIDYISTDDTSGEYYANQDGIVQVSKWNKLSVDGKEYWVYSQADGTLAQDKVLTINGTKYLFDENYRLVT